MSQPHPTTSQKRERAPVASPAKNGHTPSAQLRPHVKTHVSRNMKEAFKPAQGTVSHVTDQALKPSEYTLRQLPANRVYPTYAGNKANTPSVGTSRTPSQGHVSVLSCAGNNGPDWSSDIAVEGGLVVQCEVPDAKITPSEPFEQPQPGRPCPGELADDT